MRLTKQVGLPAVAILGLLIAVAWMAGLFSDKTPAGVKPIAEPYTGSVVNVDAILKEVTERAPGSVVAKENTLIASRLLAQLKSLNVRAGDKVVQGQTIARLDDADLKAQVSQVKAEQDANDAQLSQATKQLERSLTLLNQGLVAINQVDEWRAKVNELTARKNALEQQLTAANVALGFSVIQVPFAGTVVERLVEPGAIVSPGMPIVSLYNPAQLQVQASVREHQAAHMRLGDRLKVYVPATDLVQYATISEIVPVADSNARNFLVKLDMGLLPDVIPGMYAQIEYTLEQRPALMIPAYLVKQFGQLEMVQVVEEGQVSRRFVRLGKHIGDQVEVLSGLGKHDKLAVF
ncbi:putative multidrug efflux system (AcrA/AcrE family) protein [Pseudoalteromonas luteoviolacea B = ATCC 29581]|nr:putative multidrug efflux system (AcrA/AcrE family) protein [Pseudoalteromonas luteoviolacea B = ATCC 29581]